MAYYGEGYKFTSAKGRDARSEMVGGGEGHSKHEASIIASPRNPGKDMWQYAQSTAKQRSLPELQCPEFLWWLPYTGMMDYLVVHVDELRLQAKWYHVTSNPTFNHTVGLSDVISPHP